MYLNRGRTEKIKNRAAGTIHHYQQHEEHHHQQQQIQKT
jgi:hypothetical protein